jgi:uncharacterized protein YhaN
MGGPQAEAKLVTAQEFAKLEMEIPKIKAQLESLKSKKVKAESVIETADVSEDDISSLMESLESKENSLRENARKMNVYQIVSEAIGEAFTGTIAPSKDIINKKISEYFSILTGGKYIKVELDQQTINLSVYSPEKKQDIVVTSKDSELSRGTTDQLFLAARLALLDIIDQGKGIPLFLDDPFVTFDDERLANAMKLLQEISKKHQIFIFTCKNTYDGYADKVIAVT